MTRTVNLEVAEQSLSDVRNGYNVKQSTNNDELELKLENLFDNPDDCMNIELKPKALEDLMIR